MTLVTGVVVANTPGVTAAATGTIVVTAPSGDSPTYNGVIYSRMHGVRKFIQPMISRTKHRYRGRRESHKINLEINQVYADLDNIARQITAAESVLTSDVDAILNGRSYTDIYYAYDDIATPALLSIETIDDLKIRASAIAEVLERLEGKEL